VSIFYVGITAFTWKARENCAKFQGNELSFKLDTILITTRVCVNW